MKYLNFNRREKLIPHEIPEERYKKIRVDIFKLKEKT